MQSLLPREGHGRAGHPFVGDDDRDVGAVNLAGGSVKDLEVECADW